MIGRPLTFAVVALGYNGQRMQPGDAPQTTIVPQGDQTKPLAPEFFDLDIRSKESIYLEWSESRSNDVSHYIVRYSPVFQGADFNSATIIANRQPYASTSITVPARLGTYFVKTVDTFGNVSEGAVLAITPTATLNDDIELQIVEEPTWPGALESMEIKGGFLQSLGLDDFTYATGGVYLYKKYLDFRHIHPITFTAQIEAEAIMDGVAIDPSLVGEEWDAWFELRSADNAKFLIDWPILTKVEPNLIFSGAMFGPWRKFYAGEYTGRFFQFRLCVASRDPRIGVRIKKARVDVSARIRVDGDYDVQCPAEGLRVTFEPPYYETPALAITQDSAQEGDRAVVYAKDRFGFNIAFVNKDGVDSARQFDWIARGWGKEEPALPPFETTRSIQQSQTAYFRGGTSRYMRSITGDNNGRGKYEPI
jgi:hypothetical protein